MPRVGHKKYEHSFKKPQNQINDKRWPAYPKSLAQITD